ISKYRGTTQAPRPAAEEARVATRPEEHGFLQDVESTGPVPHLAEAVEGEGHRAEPAQQAETGQQELKHVEPPPVETKPEPTLQEARFEHMNLAATFGGDATETGEEAAREEFEEESGEAARAGAPFAAEPQAQTSAPGVVEEEEIEE